MSRSRRFLGASAAARVSRPVTEYGSCRFRLNEVNDGHSPQSKYPRRYYSNGQEDRGITKFESRTTSHTAALCRATSEPPLPVSLASDNSIVPHQTQRGGIPLAIGVHVSRLTFQQRRIVATGAIFTLRIPIDFKTRLLLADCAMKTPPRSVLIRRANAPSSDLSRLTLEHAIFTLLHFTFELYKRVNSYY